MSLKKEEEKQKNKHLILPDICVCCGASVPEGRQICWQCEHFGDEERKTNYFRNLCLCHGEK